MKKLSEFKVLIFTLITGIVIGILTFLQFTRPDDDSELLELQHEGEDLREEINGITDELDNLKIDELTDSESHEMWADWK